MIVSIKLKHDYENSYYLTNYMGLIEDYKVNDFNKSDIVFKNQEEAKKKLNEFLKSYKYDIDAYFIEDKEEIAF